MITLTEILEGTTPTYRSWLKDELGAAVQLAALSAVRLTFYSVHSGAVVNTRSNQNVKGANNVTISTLTGEVLWKLQEADTILIDVPKPTLGLYRAVFVFEWADVQAIQRQIVHEVTFQIKRAINAPFAA